jgi:hypothetical protein
VNGDNEREGEEFPRLHACSTVDRPLETTTAESTARKSGLFFSVFGHFGPNSWPA